MSRDPVLLSELTFTGGVPSSSATRHEVPGAPTHLVLVCLDEFYVVRWAQSDGTPDHADLWAGKNIMVEVVVSGKCFYKEDGVRHAFVGDAGYLHYPDLRGLSSALALVAQLIENNQIRSKP